MATPDYLQQVIVSGRKQAGNGRRTSAADSGLFRRPSITSSVWASVDMLTVVVAAVLALRFRVATPSDVSSLNVLPHLIQSSPNLLFFYIGWFGVCLIFFTRSYGLYGPIQHRSGLHEQRMTVQAALTSGLLLCGTLYLSNGEAISRVVVALMVLLAVGVRPWESGDDWQATLFSLVTFMLAAGVITAIGAEFLRGASVVATQTGKNLLASTVLLVRRNTRRYGGYIVHFGIVVMFIGIAGGAFNQSHEQEMGAGDATTLGPYRVVCQTYTQDSNKNFDTEYALLDVFKGGKKITQLAPERRFYQASQTSSTMVALHSTLASDLYVIYEGRNPDTDKPIIKVFLNPLMNWIWIGVLIVVMGTFLALVPNLTRTPARVVVTEPVLAAAGVQHV